MTVRSLSKQLHEKAISELGEDLEQTQEQILAIKTYLKESLNHLRPSKDDQWILNFLRGCKFNLTKTKSKLKILYTLKSSTPEFFQNRDPFLPEIQNILNKGILLLLPNVENPETGPPLLMVRWENVDYDTILFKDLVKVAMMSLEIAILENDSMVISGQHILQDFHQFNVRYITQMTPYLCRKTIMCLQSAYPTRIKGVHFVNVPIFFRIIHNMINPFLNKKLRERVHIYTEQGYEEIVNNNVPLSIFPKDYGGQNDSVSVISSEWKKKVESYREWFLKDSET